MHKGQVCESLDLPVRIKHGLVGELETHDVDKRISDLGRGARWTKGLCRYWCDLQVCVCLWIWRVSCMCTSTSDLLYFQPKMRRLGCPFLWLMQVLSLSTTEGSTLSVTVCMTGCVSIFYMCLWETCSAYYGLNLQTGMHQPHPWVWAEASAPLALVWALVTVQ